jgi:aryl-alcohol dehydrogenase-like predicted oxidoreductase
VRHSNQPLVDLLDIIAARSNATPAQIALACLLTQKPFIVPIPSTRKLHRLEENLSAAEVSLSEADVVEINAEAAKIQIQGSRGTGHEKYL